MGQWCHNCGQRHDDCRRSIRKLAAETVVDAAALDGRFARTFKEMLLKPGRHVRSYAHGRRSPFTPPVRFFLLVSFLFFLTLWITDRHLFVFQLIPTDNQEEGFSLPSDKNAAREEAIELSTGQGVVLDFSAEEVAAEDAEAIREDLEAAREGLASVIGAEAAANVLDEEALAAVAEARQRQAEEEAFSPRVVPYGGFLVPAQEVEYTEEELAWIRSWFSDSDGVQLFDRDLTGRRLGEALAATMQNPNAFNNALNEAIPLLMVMFIPLMAVLGATFVRGQDALIYDHLLVSIQTHAFAFLVLTFILATAFILPGELAGWLFFGSIPVYYLVAIRGAFGRSWRKSVVATLFVGAIYNVFFIVALFATMAISLLEIA
jgi:hypothetical protein